MRQPEHWQGPNPGADQYRQIAEKAYRDQTKDGRVPKLKIAEPHLGHIGPIWMQGVINHELVLYLDRSSEILQLEMGERAATFIAVESFLSRLATLVTTTKAGYE